MSSLSADPPTLIVCVNRSASLYPRLTKGERIGVSVLAAGHSEYADAFAGLSHVEAASVGTAYPSAASLVELAQPRVQREEFVQPWELELMYLRQADVDPAWDRRLVPHRSNVDLARLSA